MLPFFLLGPTLSCLPRLGTGGISSGPGSPPYCSRTCRPRSGSAGLGRLGVPHDAVPAGGRVEVCGITAVRVQPSVALGQVGPSLALCQGFVARLLDAARLPSASPCRRAPPVAWSRCSGWLVNGDLASGVIRPSPDHFLSSRCKSRLFFR